VSGGPTEAAASPSPESGAPQLTQKRAPASASVPHCGQLRCSGSPQAMQKRAAAGFSTAQLPQVRTAFMFDQ
jgi:hypothetical protein